MDLTWNNERLYPVLREGKKKKKLREEKLLNVKTEKESDWLQG